MRVSHTPYVWSSHSGPGGSISRRIAMIASLIASSCVLELLVSLVDGVGHL